VSLPLPLLAPPNATLIFGPVPRFFLTFVGHNAVLSGPFACLQSLCLSCFSFEQARYILYGFRSLFCSPCSYVAVAPIPDRFPLLLLQVMPADSWLLTCLRNFDSPPLRSVGTIHRCFVIGAFRLRGFGGGVPPQTVLDCISFCVVLSGAAATRRPLPGALMPLTTVRRASHRLGETCYFFSVCHGPLRFVSPHLLRVFEGLSSLLFLCRPNSCGRAFWPLRVLWHSASGLTHSFMAALVPRSCFALVAICESSLFFSFIHLCIRYFFIIAVHFRNPVAA